MTCGLFWPPALIQKSAFLTPPRCQIKAVFHLPPYNVNSGISLSLLRPERGNQHHAKRWQIELFFRWIKQNLRIKTFYGTSDNAVKTQIWIALCVYVLVAILKKELKLEPSLYEILQILSVTPFEQTPLQELLTKTYDPTRNPYDCNQLPLW